MPLPDGLEMTALASCEAGAVLRISGELDHFTEQLFRASVGTFLDRGHHHVVLDCATLTFCDSRGLNCLLSLQWLLERRQGRLLLARVRHNVARVLHLTGSGELLRTYPTVAQALATLPREERPGWPGAGSLEGAGTYSSGSSGSAYSSGSGYEYRSGAAPA
ncbi:STAS domain-containing protein [Streptomyces ochraceiscleroticus]|uniref:Anti-sigma factor antagonist n=1 Tax=Streptomyces ochraceiscleroticus TaxID=47761 RepID=A0ABW1MR38_9ACTN|nr:STAS domain-containing protein [Streptomyces ochraceiscleroticus]